VLELSVLLDVSATTTVSPDRTMSVVAAPMY